MRGVIVGVVMGSWLAWLADPAAALVMCGRKGRSGEVAEGASIKLRDVCRTSEVQVDPMELNLQGPTGDPGTVGPPGPVGPPGVPGAGLVLRDMSGNKVGDVLDPFTGDAATVLIDTGSVVV